MTDAENTPRSADQKKEERSRKCPYLDTVDRTALDFDFEKQCSVTLSHLNVYACLVCGKFFQGRGINSQASNHALQVSHHVFINLHSTKIYCLPENYEVIDSSLDDIKYALNPTFTKKEVAKLDSNETRFRTVDGSNSTYQPGIVGFNDSTNQTSPINAILQALVHVPILRNFFIFPENYSQCNSRLGEAFGHLVRKVWCKGLLKPQVSPHEMIQAISVESKKHFESRNYEPIEFLSWFLNQLHRQLGGTKRIGSSPVHHCFQGVVQVSTYNKCTNKDAAPETVTADGYNVEPEIATTPFLHLSLDVPPAPVFTSEREEDIIPQVPLYDLLAKFNGEEIQYIAQTTQKKQYIIVSPPRYLILHIKRFTRNQYFTEKNHTIVNFPMQDLDIAEYCRLPEGSRVSTKYNLLANICHQGQKDEKLNKTLTRMEHEGIKGTCLMNKQNKGDETWYTIQDLIVEPTMPQMVALTEAYIQIYERVD